MRLTAISILASAATATAAVRKSGFLHVLTFSTSGTPAPRRIGCVNADGRIGTTGCAEFKLTDDYILSSGVGQCSVADPTQPENTDSIYGRGSYALNCGPQYSGSDPATYFYAVEPFPDRLCTGNQRCTWDLKTTPGSSVPVWPFLWGSQQSDVPAGHVHVTLTFSPNP